MPLQKPISVQHFNIVVGALSDALGLNELALFPEELHPLIRLGPDVRSMASFILSAGTM